MHCLSFVATPSFILQFRLLLMLDSQTRKLQFYTSVTSSFYELFPSSWQHLSCLHASLSLVRQQHLCFSSCLRTLDRVGARFPVVCGICQTRKNLRMRTKASPTNGRPLSTSLVSAQFCAAKQKNERWSLGSICGF